MPLLFKLTPAAKTDLADIARYTADKWGKRQALKYAFLLDQCFQQIAEEKDISKTILPPVGRRNRSAAGSPSKATVRKLAGISKHVHTITFDNGKEFADHQNMASALDADIFFAKPYHAWERGLNENTNGLIRDFFLKRTNFSTITSAEVAKVERLLNDRPRKSLGFKSPKEVFLVAALT